MPIGEPGHSVNVTFGYWLQYPPDWTTGFGDRPLLVSLSNLDPGSHNRASMRAEGCLIEVKAVSNVHGCTFDDLMTQLPRSFPDAEWLLSGPLGDIYVVTCLYRADQEDKFRPIANAIIYSLEF